MHAGVDIGEPAQTGQRKEQTMLRHARRDRIGGIAEDHAARQQRLGFDAAYARAEHHDESQAARGCELRRRRRGCRPAGHERIDVRERATGVLRQSKIASA
jgi:hypothetical protein